MNGLTYFTSVNNTSTMETLYRPCNYCCSQKCACSVRVHCCTLNHTRVVCFAGAVVCVCIRPVRGPALRTHPAGSSCRRTSAKSTRRPCATGCATIARGERHRRPSSARRPGRRTAAHQTDRLVAHVIEVLMRWNTCQCGCFFALFFFVLYFPCALIQG